MTRIRDHKVAQDRMFRCASHKFFGHSCSFWDGDSEM